MKSIKLALVMTILVFTTITQASSFIKEATHKPVLVQDGEHKHWCSICGMKIGMFYKTSHTSELKDSTKRQYCSIRCLSVDNNSHEINLENVSVVDAKTEKIIDAKKAFYVVGSKIPGTMSSVSKIAFVSKKDALEFQEKYNGKILNFDETFKQANESLADDISMVTKKKEKKVYPKGEKLFTKKCNQNIDLSNYKQINSLKADIVNKKICHELNEKQLQAVSLYLWEVKRINKTNMISNKMIVGEDEKCPVCGMYTSKYPKWIAQLYFTHGDHDHHFTFDGVKDLFKFYLDPKKWGNYEYYKKEKVSKILVTDYYTQKVIDAQKAYYVTGSDIHGPMGYEIIPFEKEKDAEIFKKDHYGKSILKFKDINVTIINNLGEN